MPYPTDFRYTCISCAAPFDVWIDQIRNDRDFHCPECDALHDVSEAVAEAAHDLLSTEWPEAYLALHALGWGRGEPTLLISAEGSQHRLVISPAVIRSGDVVGAIEALRESEWLEELRRSNCVRLSLDKRRFVLTPCNSKTGEPETERTRQDGWG